VRQGGNPEDMSSTEAGIGYSLTTELWHVMYVMEIINKAFSFKKKKLRGNDDCDAISWVLCRLFFPSVFTGINSCYVLVCDLAEQLVNCE
jgi:hypothetical protein